MDLEKYKSILHYIIHKTENQKNVGKTVLYKILYFLDFNYYEKYTKLITGETYKKISFGPAPIHFKEIISELKKEGKIDCNKLNINNSDYVQFKYTSKTQPTMNIPSDEKKEIDEVIEFIGSMSAKQVTEYSHEDTPWKVSEINELLDPELVFYRTDQYSVTNSN